MWLPPTFKARAGLRGIRVKLGGTVFSACSTISRGMRVRPLFTSTIAPALRKSSQAAAPWNSMPISSRILSEASWIASIWSWLSGVTGGSALRSGPRASHAPPSLAGSRARRGRRCMAFPLWIVDVGGGACVDRLVAVAGEPGGRPFLGLLRFGQQPVAESPHRRAFRKIGPAHEPVGHVGRHRDRHRGDELAQLDLVRQQGQFSDRDAEAGFGGADRMIDGLEGLAAAHV